ncbi:MAG: hypothetical protein JXR76_17500 [Deltaproteobacteria bacterium]|nr:hypothetical protein [Deltaproteobacteria bacterium]
MSEKWTRHEFQKHLNKMFNIKDADGNAIEAELVEVKDQSSQNLECFAVMFKGPSSPKLPHDVLTLSSSDMGEHALLLGPVFTGEQDATYYEAVFNKLKK